MPETYPYPRDLHPIRLDPADHEPRHRYGPHPTTAPKSTSLLTASRSYVRLLFLRSSRIVGRVGPARLTNASPARFNPHS
jgi:hypothetical protein